MTALPSANRFHMIPAELIAIPSWVTWDYVTRTGKDGEPRRTKIPKNPRTGEYASATNAETWADFVTAYTDLEWGHRDGIGFVLSMADPFFLIDLDSAIDIDMPTPDAAKIVDRFADACYVELSPSHQGLHIIGRGALRATGNKKGKIEVYDNERFLTITGNVYDGHTTIGPDCSDELAAFHTEIFAPVIEAASRIIVPPAVTFTDDELIERALNAANGEKLRAILSGDDTGYASASEADSAAAAMLAFWTTDTAQVERILRLSGRQRDKWDEHRSYLARTVENAQAITSAHYAPPSNIVDFRKHLGDSASGDDSASGEEVIAGFRLSDIGNAERLAQRVAGQAHYCFPAKRWYRFDGQRWRDDAEGWIVQQAKKSVLAMYGTVPAMADKDRTAVLKHALKSESERSLNAAVNLAKSEPCIPILPDAFDRDRMLLNVENGTLDLRTGELHPHNPEDAISKLAPVTFDPEATCPRWLAFLDQIFEGDAERMTFVQNLAGYSMTGLTTERIVVVLWGAGRNGKSTMLKTLSNILGDYAQRTPTETLMLKRYESGPSNDVAILRGARLVTASETEEGRKLNVAKIKDLSGDEELAARFLYGETFNFRPQFTIWFSTNHKPIVPGNDRALFDRLRLVPFTWQTPEDQIDKTLESVFSAESSGILNWMLAGCLAWQRDGLGTPEAVKAATQDYRTEMDQVGSFIGERCVVGPDFRASSSTLYAAYKTWCDTNGEKKMVAAWFGRQLGERGFDAVHDGPKRTRTWIGIGILDDKQEGERQNAVQNGITSFAQCARAEEEFTGNSVHAVHAVHAVHNESVKLPVEDNDGWQ